MLKPGADDGKFTSSSAAEITGYVVDVKVGGIEQCNCGTHTPAFRDSHIEVAIDDQNTAETQRVIVEVTPRIREMMATKGMDWSTDNLKTLLIGHTVKFQGWMLFDFMHKGQAQNTHPNDPKGKNWRATSWEIHPVTDIQLMDAEGPVVEVHDELVPASPLTQSSTPTNNQPKTPMNTPVDILATILLGGILGMAGQGARVIVGLKKTNDSALKDNKTFSEVFELQRLLLSLLYAFAIGGVAGVLMAVQNLTSVSELPWRTEILMFISAGYIGTDFIEGFVNKNLKKS